MPTESEIPAISEGAKEESSIHWIEILSVLWNSKKLIAYVTGSVTVIAVIVSLLLPEYYRSTATLLPETEKGKLSALGGISDLAALAGVSVGGEVSLAKLYPTIIKSEAVLQNVIYARYQTRKFNKPVNLVEFWEIEGKTREQEYEAALKTLRDELEVSLDNRTNVVTISILTREPQLSADIVNNVTKELDRFIRTKRTTNASEQRKWIEDRLVEVKADLEKSENRLKEFREKNRRVADSPQLLLEQERLIREVTINSTIYTELKKQQEIVKIEEIKNIPIINVMDDGRAAARKEKPKRATIVLVSVFLSVAASMVYVIAVHRYDEPLKKMGQVFIHGKAQEVKGVQ
jgi:uncharacterized protein involved in exopolysaccharide biosynthesis